jgi:hypothetical protein
VVILDFITKLPITVKHHNSIMVVVDKIKKVAHFILVKTTHKATNIANIYMKEYVSNIPKDRAPVVFINCKHVL